MPRSEGILPPVGRLVRITVGLMVLAFGANYLNAQSVKLAGISLVWLSNGFLIGSLLCSIRRQWPALLILGFLVDIGLNFASGGSVAGSLTYSISNMIEVLLGASLMYPAVAKDPDLTDARQLSSFLLFGAVVAPAVASLLVTVYLRLHNGIPFSSSVRFWFAADLLGIALITPLYLSWHHRKQFTRRSALETVVLFVLLFAVTVVVFRMTTYPMLWFVLLFLILLGVRVGFTGSALGLLMVMCIGGYLTSNGYGPLSQGLHESLKTRVLIFQSFITLSMIALYCTEAAMSANQRMLSRLRGSETRFRSLAEASRDLIVLADLNGDRRYVSPAVTEMLGWKSADLVDTDRQITHPDDLGTFDTMLNHLREGKQPPALAYRCLRKDGSYLWLEASARLMRDDTTNEPSGFVYVLRDISDRRAAEEKMQEAFRTVERQAMRDGLTGVANRRLLDKTLRVNWQRGARDRTPLSLLLIDVDQFKAYNDLYGHLAGDECLRRIASAIQTILRRPQDLLARYGGEEFVAVLPSTYGPGAEIISEHIRECIESLAIPHDASPHGVVTVSLGCATIIPGIDIDEMSLIKSADAALYRAKTGGRNRTRVSGDELVVN